MPEQPHPTRTDDGRNETPTQRMDRNWNELLQELRVAQTGVQILTGFLLTVPFQQRFTDLDEYQKDVYLVLVVLAVAATGFIVAPVSLHRILFRRRLKRELVESADRMAQTGLAMLALVLAGSALLLFDVVVGRTAGWVVGALVLVGLAVVWLAVPLRLSRNAHRDAD
jgi:O-antigen/teichoic acid export membrane protein